MSTEPNHSANDLQAEIEQLKRQLHEYKTLDELLGPWMARGRKLLGHKYAGKSVTEGLVRELESQREALELCQRALAELYNHGRGGEAFPPREGDHPSCSWAVNFANVKAALTKLGFFTPAAQSEQTAFEQLEKIRDAFLPHAQLIDPGKATTLAIVYSALNRFTDVITMQQTRLEQLEDRLRALENPANPT